jgi:hypothetical protein
MHGGAPGSGAPQGNKNALKHGRHTRESVSFGSRLSLPFIWRMDFLGMAKVKGFMVRIGPHHYGLAQCPDDPGGIISSSMPAVPSRRLEAPEPRAR